MIRVLVADDQPLVRAGLRTLIEGEPDIAITGEAANGSEAVTLAAHSRPDVVLMDIRMPVLDGLEATRQIVADANLDGVRVLILTTFESDEYIFEALRGGASGFLVKDTEPEELLEAIRVVAAGNALLSPTVTRRVIAEFAAQPHRVATEPPQLDELTEREREVVALVGHGLSNREIAQLLTVTPATAKTHVNRAMIKLGAHDRAQLVVIAYETGLVSPKSP